MDTPEVDYVFVVKQGPMLFAAFKDEWDARAYKNKKYEEPNWYPEWSWGIEKLEVR